jgi:hypothetical protein
LRAKYDGSCNVEERGIPTFIYVFKILLGKRDFFVKKERTGMPYRRLGYFPLFSPKIYGSGYALSGASRKFLSGSHGSGCTLTGASRKIL